MIALLIFVFVFLLVLLLNEYYFHIVLRNTQEHKILKGLKGEYDYLAFGSSYGLYGISFPKGANGFNFCLGGQFFYYTNKMLREYTPRCLKKGGTVFLIIADLVFAKLGKGIYNPERYPLILSKESLGEEFSIHKYLRMRYPLFFNPRILKKIARSLIRGIDNNFDNLKENELSYEQTVQQAQTRCASWCRQFHLVDTISTVINPELEETFVKTRDVLTGMIQFCIDNHYKPVLVVTPVSRAMNECLSDAFLQKVLFDNIEMANKQNVPFLNYLKDERFQDTSLYANNADFLNACGRREFTKILIDDTTNILL